MGHMQWPELHRLMRAPSLRSLVAIVVLAFANAHDNFIDSSGASTKNPPLAFAFGPGGLLGPYYLGVAFQLRDLGLISNSTPVGGASAGAVAAAALAFGSDELACRNIMVQFMREVRAGDSLKRAFRRVLEVMVPEDAAERAERHSLAIGYREVLPRSRPHIVTKWESKKDFIETILASMNFPFYFSRWPLVRCRGSLAADGIWSVESERHGCPPLPGNRTIAVFALPKKHTVFDASDVIQPGQLGMDLPEDVDISKWRHWMMWPAPEEKVDEMMAIGRAHARAWAAAQQLTPAHETLHLPTAAVSTRVNLSPQPELKPQPPPQMPRRRWSLEVLRPQWIPRFSASQAVRQAGTRTAAKTFLVQTPQDKVSIFVFASILMGIFACAVITVALLRIRRGVSCAGKRPLIVL